MRLGDHRVRWIAMATGIIVIAAVVGFALHSGSPTQATPNDGGRTAPAISGTDVLSGKPMSLSALRGRYVIVDFFASWCGTCVAEEPQIEAFIFRHRSDRHVGFIGVDIDDSLGNAKKFLTDYGATWPALVDSGSIAQSYGVADPPMLFLVDPKGKVVSSISQAVTVNVLDNWVSTAGRVGA